jgi:hypothetical protein
VLQDKQLYDSFKTPKVQFREKVPIKLEEIKAVAKALEHIPLKAYFVLFSVVIVSSLSYKFWD